MTGLLLLAAALFFTFWNLKTDADGRKAAATAVDALYSQIREASEQSAQLIESERRKAEAKGRDVTEIEKLVLPDFILNPEMDMPILETEDHAYLGMLELPSLGLSLPVISEWSYPNLKDAPCRYVGSAYLNDLVIAAHNYQSHFGRLKELNYGDGLTFTDAVGNVFSYEVIEVETLEPTAIEEMETGDWDLTLFTCTVGGQARVTVRCELTGIVPSGTDSAS